MINKIAAYDMDGVICSDLNLPWNEPNFDYDFCFELRMKLNPIFVPVGPYVIITGRSNFDKPHTKEWCSHYKLFPQEIYYNPNDPVDWKLAAKHKADTIVRLQHTLSVFVESSHDQVEFIRQYIGNVVPIVHFSDFIARNFNETQY